MRSSITLILTLISLCLFTLGAAAEVQLHRLDLEGGAAATKPEFRILSQDESGVRLSFVLDALNLEKFEADGELFDALSIPGGGMRGADGHPGLPVISKLIALPAGSSARVKVLSREEQVLPDLRLFPVQPDGAERFVMDEGAYLTPSLDAAPDVEIGEPGMMRELSVSALRVNPVRYDPVSREARVATSMEIEIEFASEAVEAAEFIPESFHLLYKDMVLNYEDSGYYREGVTEVGPGTYLLIYDNTAGVLTRLAPLIEWREKQGYKVVAVSTDETGGNNWQVEDYIDDFYATADPPLEHITLVGDASGYITVPCFFESVSGYGGEGDHYYSTIVGGDVLSDVHIGRLSVTSTTELEDVVSKLVTYETSPPISDPGWFTRAGLTGDPSSSGITTIYVNQWLKEQLLQHNYTQVDTIWGGNFLSAMTASLNQGLSVFGYRGYWHMSGMSSAHIMALGNQKELPFAIIVTCDTGSFASDANCRSEAFFRAPNGGGVASVGTATIGTHTRYNNCYYMGVWHGAINGEDHRTGSAHTRGKYELYHNYQISQPNTVEVWSMWNNLMGDPVTQLWSAYPEDLTVVHPASLPTGVGSVPVTVSNPGGPLEGARVALFKDGDIRVTGYTDAAGQVNLPIEAAGSGTLYVTVMSHNHMPYLGSLSLGSVSAYAAAENQLIDDDMSGDSQGNGDNRVNPGEAIELSISLRNLGTSTANNVSATLSSNDPYVTVVDDTETYGNIASGAEVWCAEDFDVFIANDAPGGYAIELDLTASDGFQSWTSLVELDVQSAAFTYEDFTFAGGNPEPGESGTLSVQIRNDGNISGTAISAELSSVSPWIVINDPSGGFGSLPIGGSGENTSDPFSITVTSDCVPGHQAAFAMELTFNDGATDVVNFSFTVGSAGAGDPTGPDSYGYYAVDNTDTGYEYAPVYDWVEVNPNQGGPGTDLGLGDFGWEQDDTRTVDLPFEFSYYGEPYDKISICSNGWVAMGETEMNFYRNWNLPCAGGADNLIAVFWDDLYQQASNIVSSWYDEANHRYIIQWDNLKNRATSAFQDFELILLDPAYHPTSTGDGILLMQYKTVNNTDSTNGYGTVGIQNKDRTDGLTYTYWNSYPSSAATLTTGRAIAFMPVASVPLPACVVTPESISKILPPDGTSLEMLHVSNQGEEGSVLNYSLEIIDPNLPRSVAGSWLSLDPSTYVVGSTVDFGVTVYNASTDVEWLSEVTLDFPPGAVVNSGTDLVGPSGSLSFSGTGDGAMITWFDPDGGWGNIYDGETATASINVSFPDVSGDLPLTYGIQGDIYGDDPHYIEDVFTLVMDGPAVNVLAPNGGEVWTVGEQQTISFSAGGGSGLVDIYLRRGILGNWELLASDVDAGSGSFQWNVDAPGNMNCKVKVADSGDPSVFDESDDFFTIQNSLDWISLDITEGQLQAGETDDIRVTLDATDMVEGTYEAEVLVVNNAGPSIAVPVTLIVNETGTEVEVVPASVFLSRNHPNPFNPKTSISFGLPESKNARLAVYDPAGRLVRMLVNGPLAEGIHAYEWDGRDESGEAVASGVYFAKLNAGEIKLHQKMVLLK